jgi:hypothetical protein
LQQLVKELSQQEEEKEKDKRSSFTAHANKRPTGHPFGHGESKGAELYPLADILKEIPTFNTAFFY